MSPNYTPKLVNVVNYMLYVFYYSKNIGGEKEVIIHSKFLLSYFPEIIPSIWHLFSN